MKNLKWVAAAAAAAAAYYFLMRPKGGTSTNAGAIGGEFFQGVAGGLSNTRPRRPPPEVSGLAVVGSLVSDWGLSIAGGTPGEWPTGVRKSDKVARDFARDVGPQPLVASAGFVPTSSAVWKG